MHVHRVEVAKEIGDLEMSANGKLAIGFDGPIPVAGPVQDDDLVGPILQSPDAFCAVVVAVELVALAGWLTYVVAF